MTTQAPALSRLGYVILFVKDTEAALAFYRDTLGVPVRSAVPGWVELDTGGTTLALHAGPESVPFHHPALPEVVFAVDDVRSAHAALRARDVKVHDLKVVHEAGDSVGLAAEFHDLDGNRLSVYGMVPAAAWPPA